MFERFKKSLARKDKSAPVVQDQEENRVLVLGTRTGGVFDLADGFQTYLEGKGVQHPRVQALRDAGRIEETFLNPDKSRRPRPPRGVILLPTMRQNAGIYGMTLDVEKSGIAEKVTQLCDRYGVPLVRVRKGEPDDPEITGRVRKMLTGK